VVKADDEGFRVENIENQATEMMEIYVCRVQEMAQKVAGEGSHLVGTAVAFGSWGLGDTWVDGSEDHPR
jgi:hypothetical protein